MYICMCVYININIYIYIRIYRRTLCLFLNSYRSFEGCQFANLQVILLEPKDEFSVSIYQSIWHHNITE